jgi:hypothetical protein
MGESPKTVNNSNNIPICLHVGDHESFKVGFNIPMFKSIVWLNFVHMICYASMSLNRMSQITMVMTLQYFGS